MKKIITIGLLLFSCSCIAQEEQTAGRVTPKEFSIPASPVFDLMGVTSSQINRTSDIKDFKVDWSFKILAAQSKPCYTGAACMGIVLQSPRSFPLSIYVTTHAKAGFA